jgi:molybdenum cofactor biosynthesis enzyme MoaA
MCEPALSSQLANTMKKIKLIDASTPTLVDWTDDPERWDQFCNLVIDNPELICLHFMGGEPLIHKKFHKFIDLCIEKQCTNFHLTFVTNGTFYNPDLLKKLSYFKSATIEISLENLHSSNDYIRQGSSYKYIKQNVLEFAKHRNQKINVVLRSVPQALSVMHYETLIDFAIENQLQIDSNDLGNKSNLKAFVLPNHIKKSLIAKLRQKYLSGQNEELTTSDRVLLLRNQSAVVKQIQDHVQNVIKILAEPEPSNIEDLRKDFIKYCQYFDKDSSHFLSVYPELEKFYYEYN